MDGFKDPRAYPARLGSFTCCSTPERPEPVSALPMKARYCMISLLVSVLPAPLPTHLPT